MTVDEPFRLAEIPLAPKRLEPMFLAHCRPHSVDGRFVVLVMSVVRVDRIGDALLQSAQVRVSDRYVLKMQIVLTVLDRLAASPACG